MARTVAEAASSPGFLPALGAALATGFSPCRRIRRPPARATCGGAARGGAPAVLGEERRAPAASRRRHHLPV